MNSFESPGQVNALDMKITHFLAGISRARARALLLDYDGTLAPLSVDRSQALPYPEILQLLVRVQQQTDTRIVIVSDRPVSSTASLLCMPGVEIWGSHGLEQITCDGALIRPDVPIEALQAINEATEMLIRDGLAGFAEHKFASIAIHWRGNEALAGHLTRRVLRIWSTIQKRKGVSLLSFDGGIEIKAAARNKGHAVKSVLHDIGPNAAVAYLGDDSSDEDAFAALHGLGLNVLVRRENRRTLADTWICPPDELADFLSAWIAAFRSAR